MGRNADTKLAWDYHRATSHSEARLRDDPHYLDFSNQPTPFKVYTDLEPILLPKDLASTTVPALAALTAPAPAPDSADAREHVPDLTALARVLYLGAGVLRRRKYDGGEIFFRSYPNTGALYHIDLYVVCADLPGLEAGVYHFGPHDFALRRLRAGDFRAVLVEATGHEPRVSRAPVVLVSASTYWRNAWKYRDRTYRHCFWDAGTLHANLLCVAALGGLSPRAVMGFADRPVEQLLGLDPQREGALTLVPLGRTLAAPPGAPTVPDVDLETMPLSPSEIDYPRVREMHAASFLDSGEEAAAWRGGTPACIPPPAVGHLVPLPPASEATGQAESVEQVILRRGSTRRFDSEAAISLQELAAVLDSATVGVPADFLDAPGATLLDVYLIVLNVEGLAPGAYYYRRAERALELLRGGEFREQAGRLGLFQHLPADAAVNVYCLTDLERVLARFGNRGYRAAQLEGGIAGGRMYLAAYAQGAGATGLTFLDDEVTEFFSPSALGKSVMFLVALGRSGRQRHRAGGT